MHARCTRGAREVHARCTRLAREVVLVDEQRQLRVCREEKDGQHARGVSSEIGTLGRGWGEAAQGVHELRGVDVGRLCEVEPAARGDGRPVGVADGRCEGKSQGRVVVEGEMVDGEGELL